VLWILQSRSKSEQYFVRSYFLNPAFSLVDVSETVLQQSTSKCCGTDCFGF